MLCTCSPQDNQLMAIERTQRGHGAPVWSLQMSMSNERMDCGPIGTAHSLSEEAERWASGAADSGSAADAGSRRLVGSRAGAPAVGGGFPLLLFRLRGGFTIPPGPRFQPPPRQTVREVLPHTAFRQPSSWRVQGLVPHIPRAEKCSSPLVLSRAWSCAGVVAPFRCARIHCTTRWFT
jgi:hypothetical protein